MEKYVTNIKELVIQVLTNGSEIKAKAESGDAMACFQMGMMHLLGINTPIDFKKASKYLGNQSLSDDSDANSLLGFIAECEGNYSQSFKYYANAGKNNEPHMNKVNEERERLQNLFRKFDLPNVLNKEITTVLNEYIKGEKNKVDASIKLAMICDDEESCLEAAHALYDKGEYYSSMRWLQKGKVPESNSIFVSVKKKIRDTENIQNLSNTIEVIELDGNSFLSTYDTKPSYVGIKSLCDEVSTANKREWNNIISPKITTIKKQVEDEEAIRIRMQQEAEQNALLAAEEESLARKEKIKTYIIYAVVMVAGFIAGYGGMLKDEKHPNSPDGFLGGLVVMLEAALFCFAIRWYNNRKKKKENQ